MKIYIKQVNVQGFEMWEAVNQEGDQVALAWSKAGARTAAERYRAGEEFDCYSFAQAVAAWDER